MSEEKEVMEATVQEKKKEVVDRDWFHRSRQTEAERQLQLAEEALEMGLLGRVKYHLSRVSYIVKGDARARTDHQEQLARQEAKRKQTQLVVELKATGISATPFTVEDRTASAYWLDWGVKGLLRFVPRIGRRFFRGATRYSLDERWYPAGSRLLAAVKELREKMTLPDDCLHVFVRRDRWGRVGDPILAVRIDESDEYVCVARL